jgi:lipopolysaccharide/colanic/teichoic acid biosynthesis glycosyltransferase
MDNISDYCRSRIPDLLRRFRCFRRRLADVMRAAAIMAIFSPLILCIAILTMIDLFLGKYDTGTWRQK